MLGRPAQSPQWPLCALVLSRGPSGAHPTRAVHSAGRCGAGPEPLTCAFLPPPRTVSPRGSASGKDLVNHVAVFSLGGLLLARGRASVSETCPLSDICAETVSAPAAGLTASARCLWRNSSQRNKPPAPPTPPPRAEPPPALPLPGTAVGVPPPGRGPSGLSGPGGSPEDWRSLRPGASTMLAFPALGYLSGEEMLRPRQLRRFLDLSIAMFLPGF